MYNSMLEGKNVAAGLEFDIKVWGLGIAISMTEVLYKYVFIIQLGPIGAYLAFVKNGK